MASTRTRTATASASPSAPSRAWPSKCSATWSSRWSARRPAPTIQAEEHVRRPLAEHLEEYAAEKQAEGVPAEQVKLVRCRIQAVLDGCKFVFPADIKGTAVLKFLATLRKDKPLPELPQKEKFSPGELAKLLDVTRQAVTQMIRRAGWQDRGAGKGRSPPLPSRPGPRPDGAVLSRSGFPDRRLLLAGDGSVLPMDGQRPAEPHADEPPG